MPSLTANKDKQERINDIAALFTSRWHQGYARGKLKHDPVFDDAIDWVRKCAQSAPILDAGCGLGLFPQWLRAHGVTVPVVAVDPDIRKIEAARAAAIRGSIQDVEFEAIDAHRASSAKFGGAFLLDVLHYLPLSERDALLRELAKNAPAGGVVYIRNGLRNNSLRHKITQMEELLVRLSGWIRGRRFPLPVESEITRHFPEEQFDRTIGPLWGRTPFNSFRLVFVKR